MEQEPRVISPEEFNSRVAAFGSSMAEKIRSRISMLTSKGKGELLKSLRMKSRKYYGEIDKLAYNFMQHGVFLHKGVGRGYAMVGGKVVRISGSDPEMFASRFATHKKREFHPRILSDMTFNRQPKEWFNPVLDDNLDRLADLVADMRADQAVRATNLLSTNNIAIK